MKKGKFIVLYSINNLGKSTQAKLLIDKIKSLGFQAEYLKYPIYSLEPTGPMLNDYLRNQAQTWQVEKPEAQAIYTLNRLQAQPELIAKLEAGINIIAEDYTGTGIAWGMGYGQSFAKLEYLNSMLLKEDYVILFDGERFKEAIETGHTHKTNEELMAKVRDAHLFLAKQYNWDIINANRSKEEVASEVWQKVEHLFSLK